MGAGRGKGISIFLRILIAFLVVCLATSGATVLIAYWFSTQSIEKRTKETIAQQVAATRMNFEQDFRSNVKRAISSLVGSSLIDDYLFASQDEQFVMSRKIERMFLNTLDDYGYFEAVSFVDAIGDVAVQVADGSRRKPDLNLLDLPPAPGASTPRPALRAAARLFQRLESTPLLLSSGNMEWFMPPREVLVEGPFRDAEGRLTAIAGMSKLDLDTASFGGVVLIRFNLDGFLRHLREVKFFDENPVWVLDARGNVIQRPENPAITFDPVPFLPAGFQGEADMLTVDGGLVAYQDFAAIAGQPFLRIAVSIPNSLLLKDLRPAVHFFQAVLVISIAVVLLVSLYVSRYLSQPIVQLAAAAARLASGDLSTKVNLRTTGEVQTLVDSFNRMTGDLRRTIAARDASLANLEREIAERTRAEAELKDKAVQLDEARVAAEAADRAKTEFLATMSHEIRTPINGVLGMTELLLGTDLNHKQRHFAGTVRRSGETLLAIINDILDFSKVEAGKLELLEAPFDLRELVEDLGQLFADGAQRKGLELACDVPATLPTDYRGDAGRLRQVLTNLIANAIKFTDRGEVVVRVSLSEERADEALLRFEVSDTGIGIAPDARARIFDAFSQAHSFTTRPYGGTGLGLAISRQLVELLGGHIEVESEAGAGATFRFTARLSKCAGTSAGHPRADRTLARLRVLIVDDSATSRGILRDRLAAGGVSCAAAGDGHEALARLASAAARGEPFDVVLADRHMPGMDGLELARAIGADPALARARRILLSAVSDDCRERCDTAGIESSLDKPVRLADLRACLADGAPAPGVGDAGERAAHTAGGALGARVLVAEDNPMNQEMVGEMLSLLGCTVTLAADGREAVQAYAPGRFDAVLMDCQMPHMDGFEATAEIRRRERETAGSARTPVVALTANALRGDRARCLAAGMDDYLSKPFAIATLRESLARLVDEGGDTAPAPATASATDSATGSATGSATEPATDSEAASGSEPAPAVELDARALANIRALERDGAADVLERMAALYRENANEEIERMRDAAAAGDAGALERAAHTLKTCSANVGATRLADRCLDLERRGRARDVAGAAALVEGIEHEHAGVCGALAAICDEHAA